jgi:hypothetical protein
MLSDTEARREPASLAGSIRRVGRLAHELLSDPMTTRREFRELSRRIGRLQQSLGCDVTNPLYVWAAHLKAEVDRQFDRSDCMAVASAS